MKDLLMTGWRGTEFARYAAHTLPLMDAYALRHGLSHCCLNLANASASPSWMKLPNMIVALEDYDRVLWVDADVVIHDSSQNIMDAVEPDAWQAVVEHETNCGVVPNCGVWVVTKQMGPWLEFAWSNMLDEYKDHPWWEQAAIMHMMGYKVTLTDGAPYSVAGEETDLLKRTQFLPPQWNHHPADIRRLDRAAFVHVTQYDNRLDEIRRLCDTAT